MADYRKRVLSVSVADCEQQTFRSGGKGGQNQNKRDTGVRLIHAPSGARGEARDSRSQYQNKKQAFLRLINSPKFQLWLRIQIGKSEKDRHFFDAGDFDVEIPDDQLKVEVKEDGRWVTVK